MIAYLDTSAAFKVVVHEAGTDAVLAIIEQATVLVSSLVLYVEGHAALARARRERRLTEAAHAEAGRALEVLWSMTYRVGLDTELVRAAAAAASSDGLRAYDALHLASASRVADDDTVFVAADGALCDAAHRNGLAVARIALA